MFIIRNNKLIYLSRMKSCLWGWSYYHYSLAQRPISHRIHVSCYFVNHMQVRYLRNRLRVNMVCEWAWVSIPATHAGKRAVQILQIGRLNQVAVHNLDMHVLSTQVRKLVQRYNENYLSHHGNYVKHLTLKTTVAQPVHYCPSSPNHFSFTLN